MERSVRAPSLTRAAAGAVVAGLVLGGCVVSKPGAKPLHGATVVSSAAPSPPTRAADALAAYRAMWSDLTAASKTSDAASPLLDDHATGGALELLRYGLKKAKEDGLVSKGRPGFSRTWCRLLGKRSS